MYSNRTHLSDGEIRALQDDQLEPGAARQAEAHLGACSTCRSRAQALQDQAERVHSRLANLDRTNLSSIKINAARRQLAERLQNPTEEPSMLKKLLSSISRPVWAAIALAAVLAVALAFPPVRAAANSFLQLFRVEQVTILPVDMNTLPGDMQNSEQLEAMFSKNVKIEENGERQEVGSLEEAAELASFPLRLPAGVEDNQTLSFQPGGSATFTVDLDLAREVLRELGRSDVELPDSLDGAMVKVAIPNSVVAQIGQCAPMERPKDPDQAYNLDESNCTTFLQMPSPEVSAPPDMDLQSLGEIYLQVLGMSKDEAALFASRVDWTTTFVVPVPRGEADYKEVQVDGVTGTLIKRKGYGHDYALIWVKNGIVYMLNGSGTEAEALSLAGSIQ